MEQCLCCVQADMVRGGLQYMPPSITPEPQPPLLQSLPSHVAVTTPPSQLTRVTPPQTQQPSTTIVTSQPAASQNQISSLSGTRATQATIAMTTFIPQPPTTAAAGSANKPQNISMQLPTGGIIFPQSGMCSVVTL